MLHSKPGKKLERIKRKTRDRTQDRTRDRTRDRETNESTLKLSGAQLELMISPVRETSQACTEVPIKSVLQSKEIFSSPRNSSGFDQIRR